MEQKIYRSLKKCITNSSYILRSYKQINIIGSSITFRICFTEIEEGRDQGLDLPVHTAMQTTPISPSYSNAETFPAKI